MESQDMGRGVHRWVGSTPTPCRGTGNAACWGGGGDLGGSQSPALHLASAPRGQFGGGGSFPCPRGQNRSRSPRRKCPPRPPRALSLLLISAGRHRSRQCHQPRTPGVTAAGVGTGQGAELGPCHRHHHCHRLASPGARRREPRCRAGATVPGVPGHASRQECARPAGAGGSGSGPRPGVINRRGGRRRADVCELLSSRRAVARAGRWRRRWRWPPAPEVSAGTRAVAWPRGGARAGSQGGGSAPSRAAGTRARHRQHHRCLESPGRGGRGSAVRGSWGQTGGGRGRAGSTVGPRRQRCWPRARRGQGAPGRPWPWAAEHG